MSGFVPSGESDELESSVPQVGGLILKKKNPNVAQAHTFAAPQSSLLGLDKLAAEKRKLLLEQQQSQAQELSQERAEKRHRYDDYDNSRRRKRDDDHQRRRDARHDDYPANRHKCIFFGILTKVFYAPICEN
jgi:hypothetical protein